MMVAFLRARSFASVGILVLTVAPTDSLVGSSTFCIHFSQPKQAKFALASLALAKNQTNDSLHAQLVNMILFRLKTPLLLTYPRLRIALKNFMLGKKNFCMTRTETRSTNIIIIIVAVNTRRVRFWNKVETISRINQRPSRINSLSGSCQDILVGLSGLAICVRWFKTIQFKERKLLTPIGRLPPGHLLCPCKVMSAMSVFSPPHPPRLPFCTPRELVQAQ